MIINAGARGATRHRRRRLVEIATPRASVRGRAVLRQGIRPDTLLMLGQFDHWATPFAKDFGMPSLNTLVPMSMELTDATGSGADIVRVSLKRVGRRDDDPLGHGRRPAPLRRLPDLHRLVQAGQRDAARACSGGACSTWRSASIRT